MAAKNPPAASKRSRRAFKGEDKYSIYLSFSYIMTG